MPPEGPVRVAMAPDAPLVVAGLATLIVSVGARVVPAQLPSERAALPSVDVVLYDPTRGLPDWLRPGTGPGWPVLIGFSWTVDPRTQEQARTDGARALLSKDLPAPRIVEAIERVHLGRLTGFVVSDHVQHEAADEVRPEGLTARELQVVELITSGLSNEEIARNLYLSINSVKTYIRTAYRKIGVTRRPQAVLWGVQQGLAGHDPAAAPHGRG
ncbi:response regulator transcription factor [Nocardioides sp. C4-1]|uniref:response regulator transcription factor n=1 Tax=Nocardioides sp. C4-1 TaxID=3151851 RepID=UPI00326627C3